MTAKKPLVPIRPADCIDLPSTFIVAVNQAFNNDVIRRRSLHAILRIVKVPEFEAAFLATCELKDAVQKLDDAGKVVEKNGAMKFSNRVKLRVGKSLLDMVYGRIGELIAVAKMMVRVEDEVELEKGVKAL